MIHELMLVFLAAANAQLFFDVWATKPLSCGRTFGPLHFGHFTSFFSRSEMVMIDSKGLFKEG